MRKENSRRSWQWAPRWPRNGFVFEAVGPFEDVVEVGVAKLVDFFFTVLGAVEGEFGDEDGSAAGVVKGRKGRSLLDSQREVGEGE